MWAKLAAGCNTAPSATAKINPLIFDFELIGYFESFGAVGHIAADHVCAVKGLFLAGAQSHGKQQSAFDQIQVSGDLFGLDPMRDARYDFACALVFDLEPDREHIAWARDRFLDRRLRQQRAVGRQSGRELHLNAGRPVEENFPLGAFLHENEFFLALDQGHLAIANELIDSREDLFLLGRRQRV